MQTDRSAGAGGANNAVFRCNAGAHRGGFT
jgi:hypothetical protein